MLPNVCSRFVKMWALLVKRCQPRPKLVILKAKRVRFAGQTYTFCWPNVTFCWPNEHVLPAKRTRFVSQTYTFGV